MIVNFSARFPKEYRSRIAVILETCAAAWRLQDIWECDVRLRPKKGHYAEASTWLESHSIRLDLQRRRLDAPALALDIAHELYHALYERTFDLITDLPTDLRKPLEAAFEEEHDRAAKLWAFHLFGGLNNGGGVDRRLNQAQGGADGQGEGRGDEHPGVRPEAPA